MNMSILGSPYSIFGALAGLGNLLTSAASDVWRSVSTGASRLFSCFRSTEREGASLENRKASVAPVAERPVGAQPNRSAAVDPLSNGGSGANAARERRRALESVPRMSPPPVVPLDRAVGMQKALDAGKYFGDLVRNGHENSKDDVFLRGDHQAFTDLRKYLATGIEGVAACAIDAGVRVMRAMPAGNLELRKDEIDDWVVAFEALPKVLEELGPITQLPHDAADILCEAGKLIKTRINEAILSKERNAADFGDLADKATDRLLSDFVLLRSMGPMSAKFLGQGGHREIVSKAAQIMLAAAHRSFVLNGRLTAAEQAKPENQLMIAKARAAHARAHAALHKWFANAIPSAPKDSKG
jgi:hypothetical protein